MTTSDHILAGCAPVPLAGYLKALGVFRLVATQADPEARAYWMDDRLVLRTRLARRDLIDFFAMEYRPTPVVAPWNGGSGFWPKDNREGLDWIRASADDRLQGYRAAIEACRNAIEDEKLTSAPKGELKAHFVRTLRGVLGDDACNWLDAAVVLAAAELRFPPLLGTGGNDGRLDFSNNFMRRLRSVFGGEASRSLLNASLFGEPSLGSEPGAVGQFAPGSAGGVNAGIGFESDSWVNAWDFVLNLEGALVFGSAAARRYGRDQTTGMAFPFTTAAVGAGSGATAPSDEGDARAEFWAPIWQRPAHFAEVQQLMSEGRAVLGRRMARNGMDFARAVSQLGVSRGIASFQRHAFLMRAGRAYFATPLGRFNVKVRPRASLLTDLDRQAWLQRVRKAVRQDGVSASLATRGRQLDEAIFQLTVEDSPAAVQGVLTAVGFLLLEVARRPRSRESVKGVPPIPPPPRLSAQWVKAADDGTREFAIAESLASLDATAPRREPPENADDSGSLLRAFRMPFRSHLAPLICGDGQADAWADTTAAKALVVWTGRSLERDLAAVLERRLLERQRWAFGPTSRGEQPLRGVPAPLAAIRAFLDGETEDDKIAALTIGLAWASARRHEGSDEEPLSSLLPLAYSALRPLFAVDGIREEPEQRVPDLYALVRLIAAGRVPDAIANGRRIARGAGLRAPFPLPQVLGATPGRLSAALLIPISRRANGNLLDFAYPDLKNKDTKENR